MILLPDALYEFSRDAMINIYIMVKTKTSAPVVWFLHIRGVITPVKEAELSSLLHICNTKYLMLN